MKKYALMAMIALSTMSHANPVEVANNIFQEFKQVLELIRQMQHIQEQIQKKAELLDKLSGINLKEISELEEYLHKWLPSGDELIYPTDNGTPDTYGYNFKKWEEAMDLMDLLEVYDIDISNPDPRKFPKYLSEHNLQRKTLAATAYGETMMNQIDDRGQIVRDYLMELGEAEQMKQSVDANAQIMAQAVYNQIEMNRTLSMLLSLKAAQGQARLTQQRWYHNFLNPEGD